MSHRCCQRNSIGRQDEGVAAILRFAQNLPMKLTNLVLTSIAAGALVLVVAGCSSSSVSNSSTPKLTSAATDEAPTTAGSAVRATFRVDPAVTLMDQPVNISLSGLPADAHVTVTAQATDVDGSVWKSSAQFTATSSGTASLAQPSTGGSYQGSDPMAMFELMVPPSTSRAQIFRTPAVKTFPVTFRATVDGVPVAQVTVNRDTFLSKGVITTGYLPAGSGIYGTYFAAPSIGHHRPAVLLFGGSEGGNFEINEGKILAAQGIPTLTLAYFGEPGLPSSLTNIPLEYFQKALKVLAARPEVDRTEIYAWGISRGSEAALLLGVHYPELVHGVIAGAPSALVFGNYPSSGQPAWTLQGTAIPFVPDADFFATTNLSQYPEAVIPVEKIRGPIFTACGGVDTLWPSCVNASAITRRLQANPSPYPHVALSYPDAGHVIGAMSGYVSVTSNGGEGGTVVANGAALADSHTKLLAFLKSN